VKLSANWMAAAGHPGQDAALFDTVKAVALELCPALGVSIPVGKDSMSMKSVWQDGAESRVDVSAPIQAFRVFAPLRDDPALFAAVRVGEHGTDIPAVADWRWPHPDTDPNRPSTAKEIR